MSFVIVRFTDEGNAPAIVSAKWIDTITDTCWFPNVKTEYQKNKLLQAHATPKKDWLLCRMRMLKTFSNFKSAQSHLRDAEETSNLETDACARSRKRKKNTRFCCSSSEEEEEDSIYLVPKSEPSSQPSSPEQSETHPALPLLSCSSIDSGLSFTPAVASNESCTQPSLSASIPSDSSSTCAVSSSLSFSNKVLCQKLDHLLRNQQNLWLKMEDLIASNKRLEAKLDSALVHQVQPLSEEDEEERKLISSLPLEDGAFDIFNKKIVESSNFKKRLLNICMAIGGKDTKSLVANVLRTLITDDVGEKYSLTGKSTGGNKQTFEKTGVYKLILEICYKNDKNLKLNIVREAISDWLMQAKFRKSKREKRSKEKEDSIASLGFL